MLAKILKIIFLLPNYSQNAVRSTITKSLFDVILFHDIDKIIRHKEFRNSYSKSIFKKKKSIVNKYCRRSNPNDENLPCFERERVKKIREKKEGRVFIIMMKKKKKRAQTFLLDVRESLRVLLMY